MWWLWIVNAAVFAMACMIRVADGGAAVHRRNHIWTALGGGALLLVGSAFGLVALSGVEQHDPWLVVLLLTAALMILSGAYIAIRSAAHVPPMP